MFKFSILLLAVLLICCGIRCQVQQQQPPAFRIVAPQNICKPDDSAPPAPNGIPISFQPHGGIKLNYKFRIFFKIIDPDFTQREILLIWKAIRALEYRLNVKDRLLITKNNDLFINKKELIPGITYIFHVVGVTDNGQTTKEQSFTLQYANGVLQNSNIPQGINLLLLGSELSVVNVEYVLHAKVTFCQQPRDYYVQWKLFGLDEEYQYLNDGISAWLRIPADTFKPGSEIEIQVQVKEFNASQVLAQDALTLTIAQRGFQTLLFPAAAQIGINKPLTFELSVTDFDNDLNELAVEWYYQDLASGEQRNRQLLKADLKYNVSFAQAGRYLVSARVSLGEMFNKVSAEVQVLPIIMTEYEFLGSPKLSIASNESLQFAVVVSKLIPECRVGWTSAQEDGFLYIKEDELDKSAFGQLEVTDLEQRYLMEIIDFDNATFTREILLNIPSAETRRPDGNWFGLQGDSKYKFRLSTECPLRYNGLDGNDVITSYIELIVHTNAPPFLDALIVEPTNGTALRTIFVLTASDAKDVLLDAPLTYELCGIFDGYELCLGKFLEYKSWETMLPMTLKPLKLFVRCCDLRQACGIAYAQPVQLKYEHPTLEEYELMKHSINAALLRTDFREAFNQMFMLALTLRNSNSALLADFKGYAQATLAKEVDKMLERSGANDVYLPTADILAFVRLTKMNLDLLSLTNAAMLEHLLDLVHQTDVEEKKLELGEESEVYELERRQRRQSAALKKIGNRANQSVERHKLSMQLLSELLRLEPASAVRYMKRLHAIAANICQMEGSAKEMLETQLVTLTIEKLKGKHLKRRYMQLQHASSNATLPAVQLKFLPKTLPLNQEQHYCLMTAYFAEDLLTNQPEPLLQIQIRDHQTGFTLHEWQQDDGNIEMTTDIIQLGQSKSTSTLHKCELWVADEWTQNYCTTKYENATFIVCACSYLGFFRLLRTNEPFKVIGNPLRPLPTRSSLNNEPTRRPTQDALLAQPPPTPAASATAPFTWGSLATEPTIATTQSATPATRTTAVPTTNPSTSTRPITTPLPKVVKANLKRTSSSSSYLIPLIAILILTILAVMFLVYYRRYAGKQKATLAVQSMPNLQIRLPRRGIHYATIHDRHLLTGNFN